jgi:cell division protein FtsI (penicillin-binding protein 3)
MKRPRILQSIAIDWSRTPAVVVACGLGLAFAVIVGRAGHIAMAGPETDGPAVAAAEAVRRADIVDRNGDILATSLPAWSLAADPAAVWDAEETAQQLSEILPGVRADDLAKRLSESGRRFVWVQRGLTPRQRDAVFALGLEGVWFEPEQRRVYPSGRLAGHLLGHTDIDGKGVEGVERAFDTRLGEGGEPLTLTLDAGVQFALEAEIEAALTDFDMKGAAGVVMDARTGAVRALASWPFVDPNRPADSAAEARLNRALSAVYELGSIYKPLTVAAALDAGALAPGDRFDVSLPFRAGGQTVRDAHPLPHPQAVTPADILAHSSNIGAAQIGQRLGPDRLRAFMEEANLLTRLAHEGPPSAAPLPPRDWSELTAATVSFGHGLAVSPLAFAASFALFANDGAIVRPVFLEESAAKAERGAPAVSKASAAQVRAMLREVVTRGSGALADAPGWEVAGKTGTAEKAVAGGYDPNRNVTSFAAVFPASRPEFVVLIVLDEAQPRTGVNRTAAYTSAAVAGRLIARIAPMLDVQPVLGAQGWAASPGGPPQTDARTTL